MKRTPELGQAFRPDTDHSTTNTSPPNQPLARLAVLPDHFAAEVLVQALELVVA